MYPQRELTRLAAYKITLQGDITLRRASIVQAVAKVAQPLEWLDRVVTFLRRIPPLALFAVLPMGLFVKRRIFPRSKAVGVLLFWAPLVLGVVRGLRSAGAKFSRRG